ncbi:MAG TPA: TIGR03435 family protein [Bryobacteraceae bacterium]|jgi:uncharacterized protein (TIGR03435 family)
MRLSFISLLTCAITLAQPTGTPIQFEVASIRPEGAVFRPGPGGARGGPGTADPTTIIYSFATLRLLVTKAYSMQDYRVSGPSWIESERYTITAKLPEHTSQEQLTLMLRNLLETRFQSKVHHQDKMFSVYELTVAKGGSKLRVSPDNPKLEPVTADFKYVDRFPQFPPGRVGSVTGGGAGGAQMMGAAHQPVSQLVAFLPGQARQATPTTRRIFSQRCKNTWASSLNLRVSFWTRSWSMRPTRLPRTRFVL